MNNYSTTRCRWMFFTVLCGACNFATAVRNNTSTIPNLGLDVWTGWEGREGKLTADTDAHDVCTVTVLESTYLSSRGQCNDRANKQGESYRYRYTRSK